MDILKYALPSKSYLARKYKKSGITIFLAAGRLRWRSPGSQYCPPSSPPPPPPNFYLNLAFLATKAVETGCLKT